MTILPKAWLRTFTNHCCDRDVWI